MNRIRHILLSAMLIMGMAAWGDYNPANPPEPGSSYTLTLAVDPDDSGYSLSGAGTYAPDASVSVRVYANTGFAFVHWEDDQGTIVSTSTSFTYTMPNRDATLTARFEYNPSSPSEPTPLEPETAYPLYYSVSPSSDAGYINCSYSSGTSIKKGTNVTLRAYAYTGFSFVNWTQDGDTIGTGSSITYTIPGKESHLVANYKYSPASPSEPTQMEPDRYARIYVESNLSDSYSSLSITNGGKYLVGSTQTIRAYNNTGFVLNGWYIGDSLVSTSASFSYTVPDFDTHFTLKYTYSPSSPTEPGKAENKGGVYGLTDYVSQKQKHYYPVYLDNTLYSSSTSTLRPAKGMRVTMRFPDGFEVDKDDIQRTLMTEEHTVTVTDSIDNYIIINSQGTENTLQNVNGIALYVPVTIPDEAVVDSTYQVIVKHGVLINMDDSETHLNCHHGGLRIMEEGWCRITTSGSRYGYIRGGGRYKVGDICTLTAFPYEEYAFSQWTNGTLTNPYSFEVAESMVIGAVFYDLGFIPDYPIVSDLDGELIEEESIALSWHAPSLGRLWQECEEAGLPEEMWPQLSGFYLYRNGERITEHIIEVAEQNDTTTLYTYTDTELNLYDDNEYYLSSFYRPGREAGPSNKYTAPILGRIACETPRIVSYDGRYLTLDCDLVGATIIYTLDGSEPTSEDADDLNDLNDANAPTGTHIYTSPIDIGLVGLVTVRAKAIMDGCLDSDELQYQVHYYYNGSVAETDQYDCLDKAFEWVEDENMDINEILIRGTLSVSDFAFIKAIDPVKLGVCTTDDIPDRAFTDMRMVCFGLLSHEAEIGEAILDGCASLGSIVFYDTELSDDIFEGIDNPNMLVYVSEAKCKITTKRNVVYTDRGDEIAYAPTICLIDANPGNYYAPIEFYTPSITYTHEYTMKTPLYGMTAGWEGLVLPFDVDSVAHEVNGHIAPFRALTAANYSLTKPFWLASADDVMGSIEADDSIKAYRPYVISMPNNDYYADRYILSGQVTFYGMDAIVPASAESRDEIMDGYALCGTTVSLPRSSDIAVLIDDAYNGYAPGEAFVPDYRDARPFEAYLSREEGTLSHAVRVADLGAGQSDIHDLQLRDSQIEIAVRDGAVMLTADKPMHLDIYNIAGMRVRSLDLQSGTTTVTGLAAGIYIASGQKIIVM